MTIRQISTGIIFLQITPHEIKNKTKGNPLIKDYILCEDVAKENGINYFFDKEDLLIINLKKGKIAIKGAYLKTQLKNELREIEIYGFNIPLCQFKFGKKYEERKFKIESKTLPSYIREILFFNLDEKDEKIIFDFYKKQERRRYERNFL